MQRKKIISLFNIVLTALVLTLSNHFATGQNFKPDLSGWNKKIIRKAKWSAYQPFASKKSNKVVFYCNLARMDGKMFKKTILKPYCEYYGDTTATPYLNSLIVQLNRIKYTKPLKHKLWLRIMAKTHARKSGKNGHTGHANFDRRLAINLRLRGGVGENCSYGIKDPLGVVISLLIDENVPNLGHRFNIFSPSYKRVGVGYAPHNAYGINCVQEFSH